MKRIQLLLCAFVAMFMLSATTAWAQYVKLTDKNGTVSWIEIKGTINGSNIEIYVPNNRAIDFATEGSLDLNEVWSESGGKGIHYQVTSIGENAFVYCKGLTSVAIPSSVTSIGVEAFYYCEGLTSVELPSSLTSIDRNAFYGCIHLTSINLPSKLTSIGSNAFGGCTGLTSIKIPSSVTKITSHAFSGCINLNSIVVESGNSVYDSRNNCNAIIEKASNTLITGCKNTKIPSGVTSIGYAAFAGCSGLTSIAIPSSVTSFGEFAFSNCSGLTSIALHSSVTHIGRWAFYNCTGLTSVTIPSSVTSIGERAFIGCSGLTSIVVESGNSVYDSRENCNAIIETASNTLIGGCNYTKIPSSVTSFGNYALGSCNGLTSIEIPSGVTSIGDYTFSGCSGLTSITSYITDVFKTGRYAFSGCNNATLYVPKGLVGTYQSTADWNSIEKIEEMPGITMAMACNNKGKVTVNGGVQFTNDMGEVGVFDGTDNTFVFTPEENCELEQVLIDGLDVTLSVKNNQLTSKIHKNSKMIVTFSKTGYDVNGDGAVDISDVVKLVNFILGQ
ncbi:MAG: leucine-rich repeat protein [Bacteroidaceae bacterium]|nr:leucine-rich repeat protein [Bacteroidaceae bacterium]